MSKKAKLSTNNQTKITILVADGSNQRAGSEHTIAAVSTISAGTANSASSAEPQITSLSESNSSIAESVQADSVRSSRPGASQEPKLVPRAVATVPDSPYDPRRPANRLQIILGLIAIVVVVILCGLQLYIQSKLNSRDAVDAQSKALVNEVGQRAILPDAEKPSISTVVDTDKLNQSFLLNAHNGDKVLLYFRAGKAIVYRPSTRQIVNIGPLSQPTAKLFLRNGTPRPIIAPSIRDKIGQSSGYTIVSQDVAVKRNYAHTLVIDISGTRPDLATRIARLIGGQVSSLPVDESPPDADFMIISGTDAN